MFVNPITLRQQTEALRQGTSKQLLRYTRLFVVEIEHYHGNMGQAEANQLLRGFLACLPGLVTFGWVSLPGLS
jgi:hypothetical protein